MEADTKKWAEAIAGRIADETDTAQNFPEDALLLKNVLSTLLAENPWAVQKLVGTGIIEDDYFEPV